MLPEGLGNSGQVCQACIRESRHFSSYLGTQVRVVQGVATSPQLPAAQNELGLLNVSRNIIAFIEKHSMR